MPASMTAPAGENPPPDRHHGEHRQLLRCLLTDGALSITACERALDSSQRNYLSAGSAALRTYSVTPYCDLAVESAAYLEQPLVKGGTLDVDVEVAEPAECGA